MLEKFLDLLKIILEKYLIPALIAIPITILSVNLFTDSLDFLDTFTLTENYIFQYIIYLLIVLLIYTLICKKIEKNNNLHKWDYIEKESLENLINKMDSYPTEIREAIKTLFYNGNKTPLRMKTDFQGSLQLQNMLRDKVVFTTESQSYSEITYLLRLKDNFYEKLIKLNKEKGCISHY